MSKWARAHFDIHFELELILSYVKVVTYALNVKFTADVQNELGLKMDVKMSSSSKWPADEKIFKMRLELKMNVKMSSSSSKKILKFLQVSEKSKCKKCQNELELILTFILSSSLILKIFSSAVNFTLRMSFWDRVSFWRSFWARVSFWHKCLEPWCLTLMSIDGVSVSSKLRLNKNEKLEVISRS